MYQFKWVTACSIMGWPIKSIFVSIGCFASFYVFAKNTWFTSSISIWIMTSTLSEPLISMPSRRSVLCGCFCMRDGTTDTAGTRAIDFKFNIREPYLKFAFYSSKQAFTWRTLIRIWQMNCNRIFVLNKKICNEILEFAPVEFGDSPL